MHDTYDVLETGYIRLVEKAISHKRCFFFNLHQAVITRQRHLVGGDPTTSPCVHSIRRRKRPSTWAARKNVLLCFCSPLRTADALFTSLRCPSAYCRLSSVVSPRYSTFIAPEVISHRGQAVVGGARKKLIKLIGLWRYISGPILPVLPACGWDYLNVAVPITRGLHAPPRTLSAPSSPSPLPEPQPSARNTFSNPIPQ